MIVTLKQTSPLLKSDRSIKCCPTVVKLADAASELLSPDKAEPKNVLDLKSEKSGSLLEAPELRFTDIVCTPGEVIKGDIDPVSKFIYFARCVVDTKFSSRSIDCYIIVKR